ncbi:unnamed protein product [Chrysoparadoxa australica]
MAWKERDNCVRRSLVWFLFFFFSRVDAYFVTSGVLAPRGGAQLSFIGKGADASLMSSRRSIRRPGCASRIATQMVAADQLQGNVSNLLGKAERPKMMEFFSDLKSTRLLTKQEEQVYGLAVNRMVEWEEARIHLTDALGRAPTLLEWSREVGCTDTATFKAQWQESVAAKETMVACNLRLVVSVAKRFQHNGLALSDLVQEGTLGLIRAAEKFDPGRGFRFSTYATWWIRQRIQLAIKQQKLVRIPLRIQDHHDALGKATKRLVHELGREPTLEELAQATKLTEAKVEQIQRVMRPLLSLDKPVNFSTAKGEPGMVTLMDLVTTSEEVPAEMSVEWGYFREDMEIALQCELNQLERDIVRMRSGLDDGRPKTAQELSELFSMPPRIILREERKALGRQGNELFVLFILFVAFINLPHLLLLSCHA